ncbi:large adhesive protein [Marinomonas mediterranea]|nr:immunoglobulin-like domain-containing protein [Marinomonas mediterranea]WCN13745.1 large adhesive protein [Marinomonas mediterranea]
MTYTAELTSAAEGDVTVTLSNGETITIADGETQGTVDVVVAADEDVYVDADSISASISGATGGNFENLVVDSTPATTQITDTTDDTTVSLSATGSITEAGGTVTYTAELTSAAEGDVTVTLSNGETITIADGETQGTVDVVVAADEDVYVDADSISASISGATGGNFENLVVDSTPATTQITDTTDDTTVSLSATGSITEAGGTVTYTAELTSAAEGDVTVTLSNGETITIADGETQGTVDVVVAADEDVYVDADSISASISGATGGNFENLVVDSTPATTQITDTTDDTTVSLSATGSITEAGGTVTYTAELTSAAEGDVTVTLSNGETITIADGETQGTVDVVVAADEDVYVDADSISASISGATGGNFENLVVDSTPATTQITDTTDDTTVSLSATGSITEAGGTVTYTAELTSAAEGDVTVTLSNGETITIADGETQGTVDVVVAADEDVYVDADSISASISGATGGNFENLVVDSTPATTQITDTTDDTTVSLSATGSITEAGGTVTYTAELTSAAEGDVTVTLSNGETITIADGETQGTVDVVVAADEDVYVDADSISASISGATGGNFENLVVDSTPATTQITDTTDDTTVSLSATGSITEAGGTVTYTAELTSAAEGDVTVTLSNGETITIADGETQGTVDVVVAADEDVYVDADSISASISGATGGNFENLVVDSTPATTQITDTTDDTTVSLSATGSITEAGGTVTYTAELTSAAEGDVTVTLSNGETITIADGETQGTVDVVVAADEDVYVDADSISASISGATGGNFENLVVDSTPATTQITDTTDDTTVSLSATGSITEAGGTVTYTAELTSAAEGDVTVTLSNGETITIADGETQGTVDVVVAADEDVYVDADSISASISGATGGNFENLVVDSTPATTQITDTTDDTTVSLSATGSITEAGGTVTYTAELTSAAEGDVTVTLSNGETITIADGETQGTVDVVVAADEDVYVDADSISASISGATGGNFENLVVDSTPATTQITDTTDDTTVSLSATGSITEAGGTVTYTAELTSAAEGDVTVTLSNGETITIADGETQGTVDVVVAADEDVYVDADSISASISGATGGNFENLVVDSTPATTQITDTTDDTTVSLSATGSITEAGGTVTYTAELTSAAEGDVTVTLSNGETITIADGETQGTVDVVVAADEDVYVDADSISASISGATGGNFENLVVDSTPATTQITDTTDDTTVSLSATGSITEAGGTVTYTAELTSAAEGDVTVTLSNGETITIADGETQGTVDVVVAADEDVYVDADSISASISGATGGNFENLVVDSTPATTQITDTTDDTTVSLSATGSITEAGGTVTYTAELTSAAEGDVTVTLSNGETITIADGETQGTVDVVVAADEDVYVDADSISASISGATGGNFENLVVDSTPATTQITDTTDDTTVSLSATGSITEAGGTVTYTAELTSAAEGDVTVTLSNGETITIADGETQGTVDVVVAADEDVYVDADSISASISGATGGNFENLVVDSTPATTQITDTTDDTTVSLSATGSITEAGGTVTYTAELTSAAEGDVTVTLSNGETITIADGETQGTVDVVVAADEDVYVDADSISASISGATGGNFENLVVDSTPATTQITDTTDDTTVSLSATGSITEAGGTVTYTAELTSAAEGDVTVTLSNGETITIADGETQGTVDVVVAADEDVYVDADSISASISGATGGNFENLVVDSTPATTQITDTTDDTTVSLSATGSITEAGGTVTYTAELTSAAEGDVTVTLSNGETITIADGETQGTVDVVVAADEDVYVDADSISASISGATGGNFENLVVDSTPATTQITDTTDDTTVSLSATGSITEAGGTVTYTAELTSAAEGDVTVTLSNGETITIADGETQGTVDVVVAADEDVYVDADSISASISGATGGNFENLVVDSTPATTQITDTTDDTTVSLSATGSITEAGGTVTYTAELTSAAEGDVTVTLSNGETITIADGETQGTVDVVVAADEDVYVDADSISASISGATGGNFENLVVDSTPATTQITDTTDDTTVSLSATGSITEAGGTVTYTAELTSAAEGDVTVTLSNGETITIADGETQGTVDVVVAADEDVYVDADSISASISGATGGNFENLVVDSTPATTQITDTTDDTTVSLSATGSITEAGGTVTYTAELTSAAEGDVTVTLSNGETITIADGETQGTVDVVVAADEDVYVDADSISASISGATGGNFENLVVDSTPATTQITDTTDDTTVSLSATGSITEAGGTVTYTAELTSAAEGDVTVTLSNGETITIADGETQGTVDVVVAADEDVYVDADSISASISGATGGNFENLVVDSTPATTQITDTTDDTTVSLSATGSITEAGGTVTYTAELTSAAEGDVTVTLSNGETITIADGETQGTVDVVVAADEDVYVDADSISASISGATGGNFENLVVDSTPATTQITDTTDDTTVSLSATGSITEAGGTVTYTAELTSAAEGDVTVTLSNGETITIADGETQGTVDVVVAADEDVYVDADSISASISGATGGNFENLVVDSTPATTQITDTTDDTTVSLSATGSITEAGGTVTYTAELTSAAEGDVTVTLSNGETITIADGETQGTVDVVVAADEDVYVDADSISASISGATGGNFENLVVDSTPATTQITDTTDDTTVSLSATGSITEAGGTVTYTAELTSAAEGDVTVTLSNGETITIADGETQGTVDVVVAADEDVYVDADSISASISGATGGNFENLVVDSTPATTQITDTTDDTTVSLSATGSITEAGGTVTYTAELTSAAEGDVTVTLSNGETITIADGETQGTVDVVVAADEDVYVDADSISASISGATGGNFENLVVDSTPATTQITDTTDDTTVSLSATGSITEAGGTVTYTAELTSAAEGDVTVTLSNGETITIADGETQGTVDVVVAADEDVYVDADSISASISGATGGNFENLVVDSTPATTQITDTTDDTTVSLSATGSITEAGGTVTYTAELTSAAEGDVTVTLSNGETITIADGETQGTVDVVVAADEDVYVDADSISASISGATGGNFENLVVDSTPATTQITDTTDDTTVSLSATGSITEAGGTVTYTAELTSAAEGDVTVTLSNGETITIADGETQGTVDVVVAADEDVYVDADSISASISGATGGNFENLVVDSTPATTQITDTTDDTTVSLSATGSITEAGGTVTYTAELTSAAEGDVTVTLSNGETITIADGETQGTVDVVVAADEDVYVDADSISASISGATGGNFENLVVDSTPATTQITDTTDDTTVSLSATGSITEAGGTVTYTAELTSAAEGDVTVTLSNGETITIADGETQGTVDVVVAADEDVYVDADSISASISGATGGNFENLVVDSTPATTQITDTTDDTTVSLSATGSITEAGGTVTYTAELTSAAEGDVTVTLSNGETITIADGETQGTVDVVVAADEDVYVDADSISASISGATGGNFENLVVDSTPATTQITDTTDDTTVSLSATGSITEAGGTVTYTAELTSAAEGDVTVTLSNGETITIADGETQGTVDVVVAADEDVYVDADSISASISGATGGNFENLVVDSTPATTQITDTTDDTTVSLSATGSITEAGGTVTYTAELTSAAEGDVTVTLSNGETITIADGETQGTVDVVVAADEDVYVDADSISASISGATGGNFENLVVDSTPATTQITDTTDDTTVSLSATGSITEAGGTVTYTAELTSAAEGDVTVTLSNGETITIADGETQGTVDVVVAADEDVYVDADSISASISGATGGNFENLVVDSTPATTQITDTTDDTTVSLSATGSITEAGGTVTYTAELTSAAEGDVTVTLSNGETITIADGETQGTVDVVVAADEDVYVDADSISASISGATGGNFENLVVDSTPATTQITDTTDDTTVSLSATGSITEAGGTVTYTAELTSAAEGDVTVTLSNGETITIADGETQGTVDVVVAADEDVYVDADSISASISGATGGNFENLVVDSTPATTQITDTTDDTTVSLSATGSITEAGGTVTYTAELNVSG